VRVHQLIPCLIAFCPLSLSLKVELAHIEKQIYDLETTYLEDTQQFGNIFVGWNRYFLHQQASGKKHAGVGPDERLFSLSSSSSPASLQRRTSSKNELSNVSGSSSSSEPQAENPNKRVKRVA
jgi:chromatin modification-related protein EAF6